MTAERLDFSPKPSEAENSVVPLADVLSVISRSPLLSVQKKALEQEFKKLQPQKEPELSHSDLVQLEEAIGISGN